MHTLHGNGKSFRSIAFASDSKLLASAYYDKAVCIWCTETGKLLQTFQYHAEECTSSWAAHVAFSPDLKYVVAADESAATIWDINTANEICNLPQQREGGVLAVAFSPDNKLLASAHYSSHYVVGDTDSHINVWCIATGRKEKHGRAKCYSLYPRKLAFSSNTVLVAPTTKGPTCSHRRFLSSSDFDIDISASKIPSLSNIDFSFDMDLFARSDRISNTISVWRLNSSDNGARARNQYDASTRDVIRVAISPDSSVVASSSSDTTVTLWRADTGDRCQTFTGHPYEVTAIAFSYDSSIMLTSDRKRTLRFWQTATGECINVLSMLEIDNADGLSSRRKVLEEIAVSADLGILACSSWSFEIFILRKTLTKNNISALPMRKEMKQSSSNTLQSHLIQYLLLGKHLGKQLRPMGKTLLCLYGSIGDWTRNIPRNYMWAISIAQFLTRRRIMDS